MKISRILEIHLKISWLDRISWSFTDKTCNSAAVRKGRYENTTVLYFRWWRHNVMKMGPWSRPGIHDHFHNIRLQRSKITQDSGYCCKCWIIQSTVWQSDRNISPALEPVLCWAYIEQMIRNVQFIKVLT